MKQSRSRFGYSEECSCAVRHQKSKAIKIQKAVFVHSFELYVVMRCPILLHKSPHLKIHQRHPTNKTKQNQNKPTSVKQREARTVDEQNDDDEQVQVRIFHDKLIGIFKINKILFAATKLELSLTQNLRVIIRRVFSINVH